MFANLLPTVVLPTYIGNLTCNPNYLAKDDEQKKICQLEVNDLVYKDFGDVKLGDLQHLPSNYVYIMSARPQAITDVCVFCFQSYSLSY